MRAAQRGPIGRPKANHPAREAIAHVTARADDVKRLAAPAIRSPPRSKVSNAPAECLGRRDAASSRRPHFSLRRLTLLRRRPHLSSRRPILLHLRPHVLPRRLVLLPRRPHLSPRRRNDLRRRPHRLPRRLLSLRRRPHRLRRWPHALRRRLISLPPRPVLFPPRRNGRSSPPRRSRPPSLLLPPALQLSASFITRSTTSRAASSALTVLVSTVISGFSGTSYGPSTPVNPSISPALAFL